MSTWTSAQWVRTAEEPETCSPTLVKTLTAVASELNELAQLSSRLQPLISAALIAEAASNSDHIREFQAFDLLIQRLDGIAIFVEALGSLAPPDWRLDAEAAAANVPLADLARRLSMLPAASVGAQIGDAGSGDFEFFVDQ